MKVPRVGDESRRKLADWQRGSATDAIPSPQEESHDKIAGLDHIVLKTPDVERSLAFYQGVLGLEADRVEEWRRGEVRFPSVRLTAHTINRPLSPRRRSG